MTTVVLPPARELVPGPAADGRHARELWPLAAAVVGYPVWWLLGVAAFAPIAATLPMAATLWRRRRELRLPPAFGWWMLFLLVVLLSSSTLNTDAPGAVPGGGGLSRLAVYLFRLAWYVACTIVLLWAANLSRPVSFARTARAVGWMFVFCVVGGLAGVLLPQVDFPSALEALLPSNVAGNSFVSSLIHPGLADVQTVLGYAEARPKAPFPFANTWGSVFSLSLPFFWVGWMLEGRPWQRLAAPFVLVAGAVPMVLSLNRGLWISLVLCGLVIVCRQAARGRSASLIVLLVAIAAVVVALVVSPLGTVVTERLSHGHSNERRSLLLQATVSSTFEGSPVVGFGSTRDVQGNFASIAGGSTADCGACGVPPLGTQGHIWLVIFANGLVGAALFVLFFALALLRFARCRGPADTVATLLLVSFAVQVFIYDTLGLPLMLIMIAIGLAARAGHQTGTSVPAPGFFESARAVRPLVPLAAVAGVVGLVVGLGCAFVQPRTYTASDSIVLSPFPAALGQPRGPRPAAQSTIDTESAFVLSDEVLRGATSPGESPEQLRDRVSVTAPSNTAVLVVRVSSTSADDARATADRIAQTYLTARSGVRGERRTETLERLGARWRTLSGLVLPPAYEPTAGPSDVPRTRRARPVVEEMTILSRTLQDVAVTPVSAGSVIAAQPARVEDRQLGKFGGSGAALGLLAGLVVGLLRRAAPRRSAPRVGLRRS